MDRMHPRRNRSVIFPKLLEGRSVQRLTRDNKKPAGHVIFKFEGLGNAKIRLVSIANLRHEPGKTRWLDKNTVITIEDLPNWSRICQFREIQRYIFKAAKIPAAFRFVDEGMTIGSVFPNVLYIEYTIVDKYDVVAEVT